MRIIYICTFLISCGITTAKSPEPISEATSSTFDNSPEETIGMVFEDKRNTERRDRTPPPTSVYKAQNKTALNKAK